MIGQGIAVGSAPHLFEVRTSSRSMWILSACLCAPILQSSLTDGFASLLLAACAVAAALASEAMIELVRGSAKFPGSLASTDGSVVVSALVMVLLLPNDIHPFAAIFGAFFAVLVVKHSFGGLGSNWLNPAAGAWIFLRFTWSSLFADSLSKSPVTLLSASISKGVIDPSGSPLAVLKIAGWKPSAVDERVTSWLNDTFLSYLGAELPTGYVDLLISPSSGLIVERGLLALVFATVVLLAANLVRWYYPLVFIAAYLAAARVWGGLAFGGPLFSGDMLYALFSGPAALSGYILVCDPGTGCKTRSIGAVSAALAGFIAFAFRYFGGDPYGALLAVPVVNILAASFRIAERKMYFMPKVQK